MVHSAHARRNEQAAHAPRRLRPSLRYSIMNQWVERRFFHQSKFAKSETSRYWQATWHVNKGVSVLIYKAPGREAWWCRIVHSFPGTILWLVCARVAHGNLQIAWSILAFRLRHLRSSLTTSRNSTVEASSLVSTLGQDLKGYSFLFRIQTGIMTKILRHMWPKIHSVVVPTMNLNERKRTNERTAAQRKIPTVPRSGTSNIICRGFLTGMNES